MVCERGIGGNALGWEFFRLASVTRSLCHLGGTCYTLDDERETAARQYLNVEHSLDNVACHVRTAPAPQQQCLGWAGTVASLHAWLLDAVGSATP